CFCLCRAPRLPPPSLFPYTTLFRSLRPWPRLQRLPWPGALPRGDGDALRVDRSEHGPKASVPVPEQQVGLALRASARQRQVRQRSEEHTSELQSRENLVCRLLLEKK